jgi:hypothetical protein
MTSTVVVLNIAMSLMAAMGLVLGAAIAYRLVPARPGPGRADGRGRDQRFS